MNLFQPKQTNQSAFQRLAGYINPTYLSGQFVTIADGMIVANATTLGELY